MNKICNCCGKVWNKIPDGAKLQDNGDAFDGYFFDCDCKSTLFIPKDYALLAVLNKIENTLKR